MFGAIRRAIRKVADIYAHPGEYPVQREYRRYLEGVDQARPDERGVMQARPQSGPYVLSSVREVRQLTTEEHEAYLREKYAQGVRIDR
jgi:hypothetical protein